MLTESIRHWSTHTFLADQQTRKRNTRFQQTRETADHLIHHFSIRYEPSIARRQPGGRDTEATHEGQLKARSLNQVRTAEERLIGELLRREREKSANQWILKQQGRQEETTWQLENQLYPQSQGHRESRLRRF